MFNQIIKNGILFLVLSLLVLIHFSVLSALPPVLGNINLLILFLVFYLSFSNLRNTLILAGFTGVLFDILSFNFFGIYLVSFLISVYLINFFLHNFFTNKSLYSFLALNLLGVIFFGLVVKILILVQTLIVRFKLEWFVLKPDFWWNFGYQIIGNLILTILVFYILNLTTRRFRLAFLENK